MQKETVRYLRAINGLSRQAFANKVGVSRQLIAAVEDGWRRLTPKTMRKIESAFDLTREEIEKINASLNIEGGGIRERKRIE